MELLTFLLKKYGLLGLCLMILLEYACFPISSEIVLPFCGAFAKSYDISFFLLIPGSVLAGLLGTSLCYFIGRIGGTRVLTFLKTKFPKTEKGITASEEKMERYGALAVCFGRVIPLCRTYIAFIAGSMKQPYRQFLTYSFFGITVWNCGTGLQEIKQAGPIRTPVIQSISMSCRRKFWQNMQSTIIIPVSGI